MDIGRQLQKYVSMMGGQKADISHTSLSDVVRSTSIRTVSRNLVPDVSKYLLVGSMNKGRFFTHGPRYCRQFALKGVDIFGIELAISAMKSIVRCGA